MQVTVTGGVISHEEIDRYIKHCTDKHKDKRIRHININVDGDFVDLDVTFEGMAFERIRRITGYLVGTLDRFNDAKRAEVEDRRKNNV